MMQVTKIAEGKSVLEYDDPKTMDQHVLNLLKILFSKKELDIIIQMIDRLDDNGTNTIKNIDYHITFSELGKEFNISTSSASKIFKKLFKMGVYVKFGVASVSCWKFNPYIFAKNLDLDDSSYYLFSGTIIGTILK